MWHFHWWLLPLVIGIVAGQDVDDESSEDYDEPLFEIDFSESEGEGQTVQDAPQSFDNLDDTVNELTKRLFSKAMREEREREEERLREMHRQREALEAQLASTNENMFGRMGGRMMGGRMMGPGGPGGRRAGGGRLGFGTSPPSSSAGEGEETPKSTDNSETPKSPPPKKTTTPSLQDRSNGGNPPKSGISDNDMISLLAGNLGVKVRKGHHNNQRCFECKGAENAETCLSQGGIKTCNRGEACQTEVRWENGKTKLESTCKQKNACMVMIRQNKNCNRLKGQKGVNRTCWRCCIGDLCNLANINPDRI